MPSFTNFIAASAFLAATVSASPIQLTARDTCGAAPAGSGSQASLAQSTGITTATLCQAQCEANNSCQSFVFGLVNNVVDCILYSVPAANVPPQSSANLIVFDKACASVPAVVPTAANPTGANLHKRDMCGSAPTGSGSQTPLSQPTGIITAELCLAQCNSLASCLSFLFGLVNGVEECQLFSVAASAIPAQSSPNLVAYDKACSSVPNVVPTTSNPTGATTGSNSGGDNTPTQGNTPAQQKRDTCGSAPTGSTGNTSPISAPANIDSAAACKAQCQADASCKSFEFGTLTSGGNPACRLFNVPAASVPAPTSGQTFVVYDVGCSF